MQVLKDNIKYRNIKTTSEITNNIFQLEMKILQIFLFLGRNMMKKKVGT